MSEINTGGPAFPLHNHGVQTLGMHIAGMTLRDYFAAKAMQVILANPTTTEIMDIAGAAYGVADAMLKARNQ